MIQQILFFILHTLQEIIFSRLCHELLGAHQCLGLKKQFFWWFHRLFLKKRWKRDFQDHDILTQHLYDLLFGNWFSFHLLVLHNHSENPIWCTKADNELEKSRNLRPCPIFIMTKYPSEAEQNIYLTLFSNAKLYFMIDSGLQP